MKIIALLILCAGIATQALGNSADLAVSIAQTPEPVVAGQPITYTLVATNAGPNSADVSMYFSLDGGMEILSIDLSQGQYYLDGLQINSLVGTLPAGTSAVLTIAAVGLLEGTRGYSAAVEGDLDDPDYDNNYVEGITTLLAGPGVLNFERQSYSVNEGAGTMNVIVRRLGGAMGTVTIDYASSNLTAAAGIDFSVAAGSLTFTNGVTTQSIMVTITDDAASECNEQFVLRLSNPTGGAVLAGERQASVLIFDNDLTPAGQIEGVSWAAGDPAKATAAGDSFRYVLSGNGRFIAFSSWADDLVANDHNGAQDIFVRDLTNHTTRLVSVNRFDSASGAGSSEEPRMSGEGSKIVFLSYASDLVAGDTNRTGDIFLRNTESNTTRVISVDQTGTKPGNGVSFHPAMSSDGRYVVFASRATDLVTNDTNGDEADVYLRDTVNGVTELISVNGAGTGSANGISHTPTVSPDGRYVAFISYANDLGPADHNDTYDLYARDRLLQTNLLISANFAHTTSADSYTFQYALSANGRVIIFKTDARDIISGDTNMVDDLFAYNLDTHTLQAVSVNRFGSGLGNGASFSPSVSADGRFVAFESDATNLVEHDENDQSDVFVRDLLTDTTSLVSGDCAGLGTANGPSGEASISADGRFVAFVSTASDLAAGNFSSVYYFRGNVFRHDLASGQTVLVSMNSSATGGGARYSGQPQTSADGGIVAFSSDSSDLIALDSNEASDILLWRSLVPVSLAAPTLSIQRNGAVQVSWPSATLASFVLETSTNLVNATWTTIPLGISDNGTWKTYTTSAPSPRRFFRLRNVE